MLATAVTFATLMYIESQRREKDHRSPTPTTTKAAIFFSVLLIYFGIFYWFDESQGKPVSGGGGKSIGVKEGAVTESARIQNIKEDCHDGIPPF